MAQEACRDSSWTFLQSGVQMAFRRLVEGHLEKFWDLLDNSFQEASGEWLARPTSSLCVVLPISLLLGAGSEADLAALMAVSGAGLAADLLSVAGLEADFVANCCSSAILVAVGRRLGNIFVAVCVLPPSLLLLDAG